MLDIDATVLVTFALVWILVLVMTRVFFKPLKKIMDERDARLRDDRASTQTSLEDAARGLQSIETGLKAARLAAEKVRAEIEVEALRGKSRLLAEAGAAAKSEIEKAQAVFEAEVSRLKDELRAEAAPLAARIENKLLSRT
jgi:F-type H+-transporting ATPase subunit b